MRNGKSRLGTAVALGAISVASVHLLDMGNLRLSAGTAGAATPAPAAFAMPVPVANVVKKTIPIYLDYAGAHRVDPQHHAAGARCPAICRSRRAPDGADVKAGRSALQDLTRATSRPRSTRRKRRSQRDTAALDYARSNLGRGTELAKSGYLAKDSFDQRTSTLRAGRRRRWRSTRPPCARRSSI